MSFFESGRPDYEMKTLAYLIVKMETLDYLSFCKD
jgi:hypothetical protein